MGDIPFSQRAPGLAGISEEQLASMTPAELFFRLTHNPEASTENPHVHFLGETHNANANGWFKAQSVIAARAANPTKKIGFFYEQCQNIPMLKEMCSDLGIVAIPIESISSRLNYTVVRDELDAFQENLVKEIDKVDDALKNPNLSAAERKRLVDGLEPLFAKEKEIKKRKDDALGARDDDMSGNLANVMVDNKIEIAIVDNGNQHLAHAYDLNEKLAEKLPGAVTTYTRLDGSMQAGPTATRNTRVEEAQRPDLAISVASLPENAQDIVTSARKVAEIGDMLCQKKPFHLSIAALTDGLFDITPAYAAPGINAMIADIMRLRDGALGPEKAEGVRQMKEAIGPLQESWQKQMEFDKTVFESLGGKMPGVIIKANTPEGKTTLFNAPPNYLEQAQHAARSLQQNNLGSYADITPANGGFQYNAAGQSQALSISQSSSSQPQPFAGRATP